MAIQEETESSIEDEKEESSQQTDDTPFEDIKQIIDERRHSPEDELGKSAPMPKNRPKRWNTYLNFELPKHLTLVYFYESHVFSSDYRVKKSFRRLNSIGTITISKKNTKKFQSIKEYLKKLKTKDSSRYKYQI